MAGSLSLKTCPYVLVSTNVLGLGLGQLESVSTGLNMVQTVTSRAEQGPKCDVNTEHCSDWVNVG